MARKKITFAYLTNESERKASYKKRNKGLMKMAEELSTLCGVVACAVTYSEFHPQPEVWLAHPEARRILEHFMGAAGHGQNTFYGEPDELHVAALRESQEQAPIRRLQRENKHKELTIFMFQCIACNADIGDFDVQDTKEMNVVINEVLREITERMEELKAAGEGPSSATEEGQQAAPGFLAENENPPGFSYWNMVDEIIPMCVLTSLHFNG